MKISIELGTLETLVELAKWRVDEVTQTGSEPDEQIAKYTQLLEGVDSLIEFTMITS